ncbi:hypothetical protein D3Y59_12750 [Hymenobacter oligotrophus]|uniref:Uncharacterized protein n=1 Tax=Hymenobacter oligotrophus TaxID=2319843 RepID=A0A3B7RF03_9BACT|nr:hypothetical protein [Hymenobacter oligotrophus]AYA37836.1 hypothetical protein D3Y59_12750 [Hymenobacter oligotrophus]
MNQDLLDALQRIADRVPEIDAERQYWFIRTNRGKFYDDFHYSNSVGIGYNLVSWPQIKKALDHEPNPYNELVKAIIAKYPEEFDNKTIGKPAGLFFRFFEEMKAGDVVVMPTSGSSKYAFGVVTDGAPFEVDSASFDDEEIYRKRRPVRWIVEKDFYDLDSNLYQAFRAPQALSKLNQYASFIDREMHALYTKNGKTHFRLNIDSEGAINGNDYFPMGSILLQLAEEFRLSAGIDEAFREIDVRQNVQSKGVLEFISKNKMLTVFLVCASYFALDKGDLEITETGVKVHMESGQLTHELLGFYKEYHKQENINTILSGKMSKVDAKLTLDALRIVEGKEPASQASDSASAGKADTTKTASLTSGKTSATLASSSKPASPADEKQEKQ